MTVSFVAEKVLILQSPFAESSSVSVKKNVRGLLCVQKEQNLMKFGNFEALSSVNDWRVSFSLTT